MKKHVTCILLMSTLFTVASTWAGGIEEINGCKGTSNDPCMREGFCSIQGSSWKQLVTAARSDKFDTQGWPGLCDMVHVALVQGNCMPVGSKTNITAFLSANSVAQIIAIEGSLACGGDEVGNSGGDRGNTGGGSNFCDSHPDHRKCR